MNTTPSLVTIAIPTYNRAASLLPQAIRSAVGQTYGQLEIIISDNGSVDDTRAAVESFRDPRIRYFRHENSLGPNGNANFCLQQATGEYFLLLHDDDLIDADFVESCTGPVRHSPGVGVIRTGTRVIGPDGTLVREAPNLVVGLDAAEFFLGYFRGRTAFYYCSTLFHTRRLREIGGLKSRWNCLEDCLAIVRLAALCGRVDIPDVKASFRLHSGSLGRGAAIERWCDDSLELLHVMVDLANQHKYRIQREGMRFLADRNYARADRIESPVRRASAYLAILKAFGLSCPPPMVRRLIYRNPLSLSAQRLKTRLMMPRPSTPTKR